MKKPFILLLVSLIAVSAHATTRSWTGGGGNNKWSTAGNWTPAGTPANGDRLDLQTANATTVDDMPGLQLLQLTVGNGQTVTGTNVVLVLTSGGASGGIVCGNGSVNEVAVDLQLGASLSFFGVANNSLLLISHPVDLAGYNLTLETQAATGIINFGAGTAGSNGRIFGAGNVYVNNSSGTPVAAGNVQFSGSTADYAIGGLVRVIGKTVLVLKKTGGNPIVNRLEIATNAQVSCFHSPQFNPAALVVVESGGLLYEDGFVGEVQPIGTLELHGSASVASNPNSTIAINTNLIAYGENGLPVISGSLFMNTQATIDSRDNSVDLDIIANVSGGTFSKIGPGYIKLRGTNTFSGTLTIKDGAVDAYSATAFGSTAGPTILAGGGIELLGVAIGAEPLTANAGTNTAWISSFSNSSWAGPITLNSDLIVSGNATLSGVISGSGDFYPQGVVKLAGSAANTFTGITHVDFSTLELSKSSGVNAIVGPLVVGVTGSFCRLFNNNMIGGSAPVTIHNDGLLDLNNFTTGMGSLTLDGGHVTLGATGSLTLNNPATTIPSDATALIDGATGSGGIFLAAGVTFNVGDGLVSTDLQIDSRINGPLGFEKTGSGLMLLDGNSTFTGQAVVQAGILTVASDNALGSTSGGTVVNSNAVLELRYSRVIGAEPLTLNSAGQPGYGALWAELGNSSWAGGILLSNDATVRVESANTLTLSGVISGSGQLVKDGPGTLLLKPSSGNTYTNVTHVIAGTLELNSASGNSIPGPLIIGNGVVRLLSSGEIATVPVTVNSSLLDLNGFSDTIGSLTLNSAADVTTGAGTLTLGGDLFASAFGTINSTAPSTISGKLSLGTAARTINVPNNVFSSAELLLSANVSGSAGVGMTKVGTGIMRLSGNSTFTGSLTVNTGAVVLASSTALGAAGGGATVNGSASLGLDGGITITGEPLILNSTSPSSLFTGSGDNTWNGTVALALDSSVNVNSNSTLQVLNAISGPGSLTKIAPGTLVMGGSTANTYTNVTFVNAGTLVLSNSAANNKTIVGNTVIGDGLGGANADVLRLAGNNQIRDTSAVTINSSGLFDLNGFTETVGSITGTGNLSLGTGGFGALTVNNTNAVTFDGVISGSGSGGVVKSGSGKLTFNGNNTFTGSLSADGGILLVNGSQPKIPVLVNSGATFGGSGTVGNLASLGGAIAPGNSPGILTCSNLNFANLSSYVVELNGTNAGSGYDQLNVRGAVSLAGSATLSASLGFASAVSNSFTIINNDGADAVTGTFSGLPQNATLNISGIPFRISYTGGTGNDVVLTQLLPPPSLATVQASGTNVVLSWPTNYNGLTLESSTNLSTNVWTVVVPPPVINFTNYTVTNAMTDPQKFFRLRSP